jgi:catechol 2,3-dioxygenase-like lactoylglutathione lyase family enzyme
VRQEDKEEILMNQLDTMLERPVSPATGTADMKLEVVVIPVSDVDRAKRFYGGLGWRLDADFVDDDAFLVQFTPPGSPCSIHFGTGLTPAVPGSASGLYLVVSDIEAARAELLDRGVDVSELFHRAGPGKPPVSGPHPVTRPSPRSAIRTATSGCCRRSPPGSRVGSI